MQGPESPAAPPVKPRVHEKNATEGTTGSGKEEQIETGHAHSRSRRGTELRPCLCGDHFKSSCQIRALRSFIYSFGLSYGLRSLLALVFRILHLARSNPKGLLSISTIVSEKDVIFREEAVRLGLFTGVFVGAFNYLRCCFQAWRGKRASNSLIAGGVAGLSVLFLHKDSQRTLALYVFARLLQCLYNEAKERKYFTPIPHGDSLLFILSSAQIMPDTLPPSFWNFIVRTGPIDPRILDAVRNNCRGKNFDAAAVTSYLTKVTPKGQSVFQVTDTLPVFPLYASLTLVPTFVLRFSAFLRAPLRQVSRAAMSAGQSTTFLASFVALYQAAVCAQRKMVSTDHRIAYFLAGIVSSLSIFIERRERRSELALYTLPRAADSLFMLLRDRRLLASAPYGEIGLFCMATSGLMYFFQEKEGRSMSPLVNTIFKILFGRVKL